MSVLLVLSLFSPGCYQNTDYGPQPRLVNPPDVDVVLIRVKWVKDVDEILKVCNNLHRGTYVGCATRGIGVCNIYLQQPTDFNDKARLATLGHETYHCLGATHE